MDQPEQFTPDTYGRSFADVYDSWYPANPDTEATVAYLARHVGEIDKALVIELGIGTGRLALPLRDLGITVRGLDSSSEMIDLLRTKPGGDEIEVLLGDMATTPLGANGEANLVFVAFNTLFNVGTASEQQQCFAHAGAVLAPGGSFVVEAFVPPSPELLPATGLSTKSVAFDHVVLTATETNAQAQTITGQHIEISEGGTRLRPWRLRYAGVAELDAMAEAAGLEVADRLSDWHGAPFDKHSTAHITRYVKPAGPKT